MIYDYSKLRGRIIEKYGCVSKFCDAINISETTIYLKLQNKKEFTQSQIYDACNLLDIPLEEIHVYFFRNPVKKNLTK